MRANASRPAGNGAAINKKFVKLCGLNNVQLTTSTSSTRVLRGTFADASERGW